MINTLDKSGIDFLIEQEGMKLKSYQDSKGIWTIFVGMTFYPGGEPVKEGDTITEEQGYADFNAVSTDFLNAVGNTNPSINQNQFNALFSLCWNIGVHGYLGSTVHRLVAADPNDPNIGDGFRLWKKPIELLARRNREVELYFS